MYKTIRHGENSLQYTILPQNDDFRLEGGKIKSTNGCHKKSKAKKPKRRSFFAYLGLLFVCTVIIGAVLVPFLVSAECLPNPTEWFLKTKNAFSHKASTIVSPKENVPTHLLSASSGSSSTSNLMLNKGNLALSVGKPVQIINKNGVEKFILKVNKTLTISTESPKTTFNAAAATQLNTTTLTPVNQETNEKITITHLNMEENIQAAPKITTTQQALNMNAAALTTTMKSIMPPTILSDILLASTTATALSGIPAPIRPLTSSSQPNVPRASLQSNLNQNNPNSNAINSSSTQPTITTRIMQVPLLKSAAKKPAIPPVLVKNLSPPIQPTPDTTSNLNDILMPSASKNQDKNRDITAADKTSKENENSDWIHTHWPYIDPSTYFQWNVSLLSISCQFFVFVCFLIYFNTFRRDIKLRIVFCCLHFWASL